MAEYGSRLHFLCCSSPLGQTPSAGEHNSALHEIALKVGRARWAAKPNCAAKQNNRFDAVESPGMHTPDISLQ